MISNYQYIPDSLTWGNINYGMENMENASFFPSTVHVDCKLTAYNMRYLFQRAISVFDWKLPDSLPRNYFLYVMYKIGYGFVFNTSEFGTIFNQGGLSGYDVYYQPAYAVVANPLFEEKNAKKYAHMRIGKDCDIIKLTPDYTGITDICRYYAELLATASSSLVTNLFNTKFAFIFGAKKKNLVESLKAMYDKITSGEPAVFIDSKLYDENGNLPVTVFDNAVKNVYIGDQLIEDIRAILNDFDSYIGIPNANLTKKERLITDEANMNNYETKSLCYLWLDTLKHDIKEVNKHYPDFNISVDFRREVLQNAESDNDNGANIVQH